MSSEVFEPIGQGELTRAPGESLWEEGDADAKPVKIREGVVAYQRGGVALGLLGPGQVALPVPGVAGGGPAAAQLVAVTQTSASPMDNGHLTDRELSASSLAVLTAAGRLGAMSLPQRLAALLLDITAMTGQPVVGCRQDILAMAAGARRETIATILSGWRDEEWIETRYRRCRVKDRGALERIRDTRRKPSA